MHTNAFLFEVARIAFTSRTVLFAARTNASWLLTSSFTTAGELVEEREFSRTAKSLSGRNCRKNEYNGIKNQVIAVMKI